MSPKEDWPSIIPDPSDSRVDDIRGKNIPEPILKPILGLLSLKGDPGLTLAIQHIGNTNYVIKTAGKHRNGLRPDVSYHKTYYRFRRGITEAGWTAPAGNQR